MKLPMWLSTLRKASGRSHATVNAQMPPELCPAMACSSGSGGSSASTTPARVILELVDRARPRPDQLFIDIGSGLGLVPLLVHLLTGVRAVVCQERKPLQRWAQLVEHVVQNRYGIRPRHVGLLQAPRHPVFGIDPEEDDGPAARRDDLMGLIGADDYALQGSVRFARGGANPDRPAQAQPDLQHVMPVQPRAAATAGIQHASLPEEVASDELGHWLEDGRRERILKGMGTSQSVQAF